jgi:ceramide glucosyltransferase
MSSEFLTVLQWVCGVPVLVGSVYGLLCLAAALLFRSGTQPASRFTHWPPVTILKPVHGLEKNLKESLRTACLQDYPAFQVVFSVQELDDPAIPLLHEIQREFGADRVTVAIEHRRAGCNGKINNLLGALPYARHDMLVISDSDVRLRPDYLKTIVAPLADPQVGAVCTLYKATDADRWFERMELLSLNADFLPNVVFAGLTGASRFCLGASTALRRSTLKEIGGLESLGDYLVEDYEMGRRIAGAGKRLVLLPYCVDTVVDLKSLRQWWDHQVYWDQNTRAAQPLGFFGTVLTKSVPFGFLFVVLRGGDVLGLSILAAALAIRLLSATGIALQFQDRQGLASLLLLPCRDLAALVSWVLAFTKPTTVWRGVEFTLTRDGRLVGRETACDSSSSPATTSVSPSR